MKAGAAPVESGHLRFTPTAWGSLELLGRQGDALRFTPMCVGIATQGIDDAAAFYGSPHVRGDRGGTQSGGIFYAGSPPGA